MAASWQSSIAEHSFDVHSCQSASISQKPVANMRYSSVGSLFGQQTQTQVRVMSGTVQKTLLWGVCETLSMVVFKFATSKYVQACATMHCGG